MKPLSHHLCRIALATGLALSFVAYPASAQLLPSSPLGDMIGPPIGDPLDDVEEQLEPSLDEPLGQTPLDEPLEDGPIGEALTQIGDNAMETVADTTAALPAAARTLMPLRPFVEGVDPFGHVIEQDVLMVLIEPAALSRLQQSGWSVSDTRQLPSLGLVLVRITGPAARSLVQAAGDLRAEFPDAAVDYNFLYRPADAADAAPESGDAVTGKPVAPGARVRVGLIDSAVAAEHPALAGVNVIRRDFVPHEGERPLGHGTAVASILAASGGDDAEILAASVFFQKPGFAAGATTESLIAALDWLAGSDVGVINMSLAGPADALLERTLERIAADGPVVVAAVGNNGPAGEPLYPAAYESVVGVTAVDRERRIFPYANRGGHVAFAAPGVDVKVANSIGGFRIESGTSMASPHVAAVIAAALYDSGLPKEALLESLKASAVDLGDEGFDSVFGYGLVQPPRDQNAAASRAE